MSTTKSRPSPLSTKSFTRYEPPALPATSNRSRASTIASPVHLRKSIDEDRQDVFNKKQEDDEDLSSPKLGEAHTLPERFDELPMELASLTDRFVESLASKAFSEPPTIDQISELFQEFYVRASSSISVHIASLRSKLNREQSPASSKSSSRQRQVSGKKSNDSLALPADAGSQLLTTSEVTERRKQRRQLDYKRLLLEEAVERRACEKVYDKLWRHRSTLDEVKDEKLRSKTAALALVGIGLRDLGVETGEKTGKTLEDIQEALTPAREGLMKMNEEHFPLGKLQHLTSAHKVIVETLYSMHGSSSSADEILPTLIYALISAPVEGINIISNLNFIQRFRGNTKIDGEAAYCMTNLEAAIGFLEEVDLASLRADEVPEGQKKTPSGLETPLVEKPEPFPTFSTTALASTSTDSVSAVGKTTPPQGIQTKAFANARPRTSPRHQRTLSDLLKPVHNANEAVRASAREGLDNISNTLDNSLKFFFGRLKEQASDPSRADDLTVPKTLDEARQLVSKPPTPILEQDGAAMSETSSIAGENVTESPDGIEKEKPKPVGEDKLLGLFGGRRISSTAARDRSVDRESLRSNSSAKKVAFAVESGPADASKAVPSVPPTGNPLDAMKNFGGSLNPLGHVGNAFNAFGGTFKSFGRQAPTPSPPQSIQATKKENDKPTSAIPSTSERSLNTEVDPRIAVFMDKPEAIAAKIKTFSPPIQKFVEATDASELQIKDVSTLLSDYQRLANLLNGLASVDPETPEEEKT
ncbi:hypothetical protein LTR70_005628 [Exophiala xenobiotica]|uniref:VPS9 domain-containing protein n=1 Tax=Lithohypha guttulata TaxID=1690604 RepID=A0ABR0JYT8_9EURO|nr:hypothetical protein LTR24_008831 [Lithohypha guttulata]KAK5317948.1 hypothetical protein LTR70_005628 [Exophiala xenobiotica]